MIARPAVATPARAVRPRRPPPRAADIGLATLAAVALGFLLVPVGITVLGSFAVAWQRSLLGPFTLQHYAYVLQNYGHTIGWSLRIAAATVVLTTLIGVPAAYALARYRFPLRGLVEDLLLLPMVVPGIAVAIALIQTHSFMRGSWWFIVVGHVVFTLPFMVDSVLSALRTFDFRALEEGAASLGASWLQRAWYVILPNVRGAIVAGALVVFTLSIGEFNLTFFLHTPLTMTLPVGMYEAYASLRPEVGSAYTSLFLVIIVPTLIVIQWLGGGRRGLSRSA